jgi:putative membrane protein
MVRILVVWLSNVAAVFVASAFVSGVDYANDLGTLLIAGAVFGVVNLIVKPVVKLLALPVVVLTFGIALFFINILMLYITSWIVSGFSIASFMDAVWGTIVIWVVNVALDLVFWRRGSAGKPARA